MAGCFAYAQDWAGRMAGARAEALARARLLNTKP